MPSSVDLPTPEPAKMPTRWPWQSGVKMSMSRTPLLSACLTRPRLQRGRRRGVDRPARRLPSRARHSRRSACPRRIDDAALPGGRGRDGDRLGLDDARADPDVGRSSRIGFDGHAQSASMRTTSPWRGASTAVERDAIAELDEARETARAIGRRRHLGDVRRRRAAARPARRGAGSCWARAFERVHRGAFMAAFRPASRGRAQRLDRVLQGRFSLACEVLKSPSNARWISIILVISRHRVDVRCLGKALRHGGSREVEHRGRRDIRNDRGIVVARELRVCREW